MVLVALGMSVDGRSVAFANENGTLSIVGGDQNGMTSTLGAESSPTWACPHYERRGVSGLRACLTTHIPAWTHFAVTSACMEPCLAAAMLHLTGSTKAPPLVLGITAWNNFAKDFAPAWLYGDSCNSYREHFTQKHRRSNVLIGCLPAFHSFKCLHEYHVKGAYETNIVNKNCGKPGLVDRLKASNMSGSVVNFIYTSNLDHDHGEGTQYLRQAHPKVSINGSKWSLELLNSGVITNYSPNPVFVHPANVAIPWGINDNKEFVKTFYDTLLRAQPQPREMMLDCDGYRTDYMFAGNYGAMVSAERNDMISELTANGFRCNVKAKTKSVHEYVKKMQSVKFVASPRGIGINCFRTWEAMYLGAVPIVRADPLHSAMYDRLPVVQVDSWAEITPLFLEKKWDELHAQNLRGELNLNSIFLPHWIERMFAGDFET